MSRTGFRFAPPPGNVPAAAGWLLRAALGPALEPLPEPADEVGALAGRCELGPRLVARHGAAALTALLGEAARPLLAAHRRAAALGMAADHVARRLAERAAGDGLPLILLKGYALRRLLPAAADGRPFVDLDVLVPEEAAPALARRLVSDGWLAAPGPANEQHLAPLVAPEGLPVDLHFRLRGITFSGEWATAERLLAEDLCAADPGLSGASLPRPPLLAAHLLVHALEQHAWRPATYPLLWTAGDLVDLGAQDGWRELLAPVWPAVETTVSEREAAAMFRLCRHFAAPGGEALDDDAERLLGHIVWGTLDDRYRRSLELRHTAGRLRQARARGRLLRYISHKLILTDGEIAARYGQQPSRWGLLGRRLLRPFELGARLARSLYARRRQRAQSASEPR